MTLEVAPVLAFVLILCSLAVVFLDPGLDQGSDPSVSDPSDPDPYKDRHHRLVLCCSFGLNLDLGIRPMQYPSNVHEYDASPLQMRGRKECPFCTL